MNPLEPWRHGALRLDRWLTLAVARPLARLWPVDDEPHIPILMYHSISDDVDRELHPYFRTVTSPRRFAQQVELLRRAGYESLRLSDAVRRLRHGMHKAGQRSVVITFDDGLRDFRTQAMPLLEQAGFVATVFLSTDHLDKRFLTGRDCLSRAEVRALADHGVEFGSHSASHRRLVELPRQELMRELKGSRAEIEDIIGRAVTQFSYPYRFPEEDRRFIRVFAELLAESGYSAGVTTAIGRSRSADPALFLPRLPVNDCDDSPLLEAKLLGHYDWVHRGQLLRKRARAAWQRGVRRGEGG